MDVEFSLFDILQQGSFEASLITTYNAFLPFYEEVVLRRLTAIGCRDNVVLMDNAEWAKCLTVKRTPSSRQKRVRMKIVCYRYEPKYTDAGV